MKPIYSPKGRAAEYGELAINIYTGCNNGCSYCFAADFARRFGRDFYTVEPRIGIVEAVRRQLASGEMKNKMIHLCFTCDPYPAYPVDSIVTREIIQSIKESGNHVQLLTKNPGKAVRDFDLLDGGDWFGTTITGGVCHTRRMEPAAESQQGREVALEEARKAGIKTWVSFEPVYEPEEIYAAIHRLRKVDLMKFGKLNYRPSVVDWAQFGSRVSDLCNHLGVNHVIKEDLRREMERT